ncbi:14331_t:CDS:2 [Gigaspora margarita]|uniref:14331_t:CDS:1 n=1 Tax=Gigaspora margarita TaxID=4874 RepID=A0ABN7UL89_GIGMA|nr:14331_t:CDS:2 [Gigaspora margarita]
MSQTIEDSTFTGNRQLLHYNNTTTIQTTSPNITYPVHFTLELSQPLKIITYNIQDLGPESTTPYISLTNPLYKIYKANCDAETTIQRETNKNNLHVPPLLSIKTLQSYPKINNELDPKCTLTTIQYNCNGGLTSLLDFNDIKEHTLSRDNSRSQIDDIWTSYSILLDVSEPKLSTSDESTKSDHKILSIEWDTGISLKTGYKKWSTNTTTFPPTPNKLQGNVTNAINDTSNSTQSMKIRTQTAET